MALCRLGLCVSALCLIAVVIGAGTAQAEANWQVSGKNVSGTLLPEVQVEKLDSGKLTLLTEMLKVKIELSCTKAEALGVNLQTSGTLLPGFKVKFTGCILSAEGMEMPSCRPKTKAVENTGEIITNKLVGGLFLNEKQGLLRVEPSEGEVIVQLIFTECAFFEFVPIGGRFTLKDLKLESESVQHLTTEGPLGTLWFFSAITPEHDATVDGSGLVKLIGKHAGLFWDGLPG